tara:strand:+ start:13 stop:189 length:177 start_codon:yes stop_codon:yes gene_type:complete
MKPGTLVRYVTEIRYERPGLGLVIHVQNVKYTNGIHQILVLWHDGAFWANSNQLEVVL